MPPPESKRFQLELADAERLLNEAAAYKGESLWNDAWRRLKRDRGAMASLIFLTVFIAISIFAPLLPLPSPIALDLNPEPQPPVAPWSDFGNSGYTFEFETDDDYKAAYWELSWLDKRMIDVRCAIFGDWQTGKWCGTDSKGRDLLSRIVWGSRTSILVAVAATLCSLVIGVTYGAFSGLAGRRTDNLMMRFVDIMYSIPFIFVVIFILTILSTPRDDIEAQALVDKEKVFFLVIGAIYWLTMARVVRGQVLSLKNSEFIESARVMGASTARILFVHVVPNVLSVVIVYLTLTIPAIMLFEAFLSFLGLGIEPPKVSWGLLAVDGTDAINPIKTFWWLVVYPAAAMGSTLLALNFLGDGLRDALDPKLRGK